MYPYYRYIEDRGLSLLENDDIAGIRSLYGNINSLKYTLNTNFVQIICFKDGKSKIQFQQQKSPQNLLQDQ